jgi:hypothetical protein
MYHVAEKGVVELLGAYEVLNNVFIYKEWNIVSSQSNGLIGNITYIGLVWFFDV